MKTKENIVIADAGSTKTDWALTMGSISSACLIQTRGINAVISSESDIDRIFKEAYNSLCDGIRVDSVYFYGAGCATQEICNKIAKKLQFIFGCDNVTVKSDLYGAALSLCGDEAGIACILGTGSSSCLYDGTEISANTPSLGFILGDEGSGSAIGKRLISDAFKGQLPEYLKEKLFQEYNLTISDVLENVYKKEAPNRYLASFMPFVSININDIYIQQLVSEEFSKFLTRNVANYDNAREIPLSFTGSIAYNFDNILLDTVKKHGFKLKRITKSPLYGLIEYHNRYE